MPQTFKPSRGNEELFRSAPPARAIVALAVPTVIAQVITVFYAVADIFYVGQLGDPAQVAAVRLAFPPFLFMTAMANLFGIGAASAIGRSLGAKNPQKASACASFAFWTGMLTALLYAALMWFERDDLLPLIGTTEDTYGPTLAYMTWTVCIGAVPTMGSNILAHLVRSEGHAKAAGTGIALGGVLNVLIAPFFIFALDLEILGAGDRRLRLEHRLRRLHARLPLAQARRRHGDQPLGREREARRRLRLGDLFGGLRLVRHDGHGLRLERRLNFLASATAPRRSPASASPSRSTSSSSRARSASRRARCRSLPITSPRATTQRLARHRAHRRGGRHVALGRGHAAPVPLFRAAHRGLHRRAVTAGTPRPA
jgi:hypothetical protein